MLRATRVFAVASGAKSTMSHTTRISHLALLLVSLALFLWGTERQFAHNADMHLWDQSSYMDDAKQFAHGFQYKGDRNHMPVYLSIMALFYKDGMSDEQFFQIGKRIGIAIGIIVLTMTFLLFKLGSRTNDAVTAVLVATFTVFAYRSPYFQTEVLYYGINLLLFVLLVSLIERPRIQTAGLAGLIGGIGHLTKASILPAVILGAICLLIRAGIELHRYYSSRDVDRNQTPPAKFNFIAPACSASVLVMIFVLVILPYIRTSKERYGSYFYNKNTSIYMWTDPAKKVRQRTNADSDRVGRPVTPETPSFSKYLRDYSFGYIVGRLLRGIAVIAWRVIRSYGYAEFLILYLVALAVLIVQNGGPVKFFNLFWLTNPALVVFVLTYFLGYLLLYAWYAPLASGNRLVLAQFLPLMLLITRGVSFAQNHNMAIQIRGTKFGASAISPTIFLLLTLYLVFIFPDRISTMYAGD
jgi:hypothetical protein